MKRKIYLAFCFVFGIMFMMSCVGIGVTLNRYRKSTSTYDELQDRYIVQTQKSTTSDESKEKQSVPVSVDFTALLQENSDIIGWLYCENTPINYPVVQSDDNDYYLRRDLHGNYLYSGTLFADYRCGILGTNQNFIIYGHYMKNDMMFGTLEKYKEQSYYEEHPVLYFLTPDGDYIIELFAGFVTNADSDIYSTDFGNTESFEAVLQNIKNKSTFVSTVSVSGEDSILMLSTCSHDFNNARYVIFGKVEKV